MDMKDRKKEETPQAGRAGPGEAPGELVEQLYPELKKLAGSFMSREARGHTLQTTGLVHEAYARLAPASGRGLGFKDRAHFMAAAGTAMRRILIDHARARATAKRGGDQERITITEQLSDETCPPIYDVLQLHDALETMAEQHPRVAKAIELRYFAGMNATEISQVLEVSTRTVGSDLALGKAWLSRELSQKR